MHTPHQILCLVDLLIIPIVQFTGSSRSTAKQFTGKARPLTVGYSQSVGAMGGDAMVNRYKEKV